MPEPVFELYKDKAGEWRWRLKAPNGEVIADSGEGYTAKAGCENGIYAVKGYAPFAKIEVLEE